MDDEELGRFVRETHGTPELTREAFLAAVEKAKRAFSEKKRNESEQEKRDKLRKLFYWVMCNLHRGSEACVARIEQTLKEMRQ